MNSSLVNISLFADWCVHVIVFDQCCFALKWCHATIHTQMQNMSYVYSIQHKHLYSVPIQYNTVQYSIYNVLCSQVQIQNKCSFRMFPYACTCLFNHCYMLQTFFLIGNQPVNMKHQFSSSSSLLLPSQWSGQVTCLGTLSHLLQDILSGLLAFSL